VGATYTSNILGHLKHHIRPQGPQELGMMVCEMPLDRGEELLLGAACELRPALAVGDPLLLFADHRHLA
jgi:hypothetical protein